VEESHNCANFQENSSKFDCGDYWRISLISVPNKVFITVLFNKTKPKIESGLREEQAAFRRGRSTVDQIFALKQIVEKSWKYALPIYCAFMGLEKA